MKYFLTVTQEFGDYVRGQLITDADAILSILASHPHHVVKVETGLVPDAPAVEPVAAPVVDPAPVAADPAPVDPAPAVDPSPNPEA